MQISKGTALEVSKGIKVFTVLSRDIIGFIRPAVMQNKCTLADFDKTFNPKTSSGPEFWFSEFCSAMKITVAMGFCFVMLVLP
jgi:hypothetical protein